MFVSKTDISTQVLAYEIISFRRDRDLPQTNLDNCQDHVYLGNKIVFTYRFSPKHNMKIIDSKLKKKS